MNPKQNKLTLGQFDYQLPQQLISQQPIKPRDSARLLVWQRHSGQLAHKHFFDLPKILQPGDVLVFNDSKVIPARLSAQKETGGKIEIFLLRKLEKEEIKKSRGIDNRNVWEVMIGGKVAEGQKVFLDKTTAAAIKQRLENNIWQATFNCSDKKLFSLGQTPLPPYIKKKSPLEDYQTIYAKHAGSVAAPTAGLHFTQRLLAKLKQRGVQLEYLTLHVGLGTFAPVKTENVLEHKMHSEFATIDEGTARRLNRAKEAGRRIIAVGTTAVRTLESFADRRGNIRPASAWTDIFIYPGYRFKFVDQIITNFHLPKSTLLMLIAAFAGQGQKNPLAGVDALKEVYRQAIGKKYKFFSFGDGMLIS